MTPPFGNSTLQYSHFSILLNCLVSTTWKSFCCAKFLKIDKALQSQYPDRCWGVLILWAQVRHLFEGGVYSRKYGSCKSSIIFQIVVDLFRKEIN
jgi:hypothetical protein